MNKKFLFIGCALYTFMVKASQDLYIQFIESDDVYAYNKDVSAGASGFIEDLFTENVIIDQHNPILINCSKKEWDDFVYPFFIYTEQKKYMPEVSREPLKGADDIIKYAIKKEISPDRLICLLDYFDIKKDVVDTQIVIHRMLSNYCNITASLKMLV